METNLFQQLAELKLKGSFVMTINESEPGCFVVSYQLNTEGCSDPASRQVVPFTLRGPAAELDAEFFSRVSTAMEKASTLVDNMEHFDSQLKAAQLQSKMEQQKEKEYKEIMRKVDDLCKEEKYKEAYLKIPTTAQFPLKTKEISQKREEISSKFQPPSLF